MNYSLASVKGAILYKDLLRVITIILNLLR